MPSGKPIDPLTVKAVLRLRDVRWSVAAIAQYLQVDRRTVTKIVREAEEAEARREK